MLASCLFVWIVNQAIFWIRYHVFINLANEQMQQQPENRMSSVLTIIVYKEHHCYQTQLCCRLPIPLYTAEILTGT